jgi:HEAT repeat protein
LAAINALGRIGDESCLSTLLFTALDADANIAESAKSALAGLPGDKVDAEILTLLPEYQGKLYLLLIELVGLRRIDAVPELLQALEHSDQGVRHAALTSLGQTVTLKRLSVLIARVVSPKHPQDAPVAQQALRMASVRMPDREACAAELALAMQRAKATTTKSTLLEILNEVGGTKALQTLAAAAKSGDPQLQDAGSRLLGKWNSVAAAPVLLDLAKTAPEAKYQIRALRGYIGLARKFNMSESKRAEMCRTALDVARRPEEQKLVLEVLKLRPSPSALTVAIKAMQNPKLKEAATQATLVIAQKLGGKVDVSAQLFKAGFERVKLEIVKGEYGAGSNLKDVTAVLRKYAGDLPLIGLPSASYNASFGGDPSPGSAKQLKIQYRINGKAGNASFAENAMIILPTPK